MENTLSLSQNAMFLVFRINRGLPLVYWLKTKRFLEYNWFSFDLK